MGPAIAAGEFKHDLRKPRGTCSSRFEHARFRLRKVERGAIPAHFMACRPKNPRERPPAVINDANLQKGLECIKALLECHVPKRATVAHEPGTVDRMAATVLGAMLTRGSIDEAQSLLGLVGEVAYAVCKGIGRTRDPAAALQGFLARFEADAGRSLFTAGRATLEAALTQIPQQVADDALSAQCARIQELQERQGTWPPEQVLAIDPCHFKTRTKFHNQFTVWGFSGQKKQPQRGHEEVGIYLTGPQLFYKSRVNVVQPVDRKRRALPRWLGDVQDTARSLREAGTPVSLVLGDREFYTTLGMAYAFLGLLDPAASPGAGPRMLVPTKMYGDDAREKWMFLLDPAAPVVATDTMELVPDHYRFLGPLVNQFPFNRARTRRLVPVARVAAFDEYGNGKAPRPLAWAREQAQKLRAQLGELQDALDRAERKFKGYCMKTLGRDAKLPSYRGRRRRVFKDPGEEERYRACCRAWDRLHKCQRKKGKLCQRLMFFTASLRGGETIAGKEAEFLALAPHYHARWGVESGFEMRRGYFLVRTRSRKAVVRHTCTILSYLVYNAWHYRRVSRVARDRKARDAGWKPFDHSSPPRRVRFERDPAPVLSAHGFIIEELRRSLLDQIKQVIT